MDLTTSRKFQQILDHEIYVLIIYPSFSSFKDDKGSIKCVIYFVTYLFYPEAYLSTLFIIFRHYNESYVLSLNMEHQT